MSTLYLLFFSWTEKCGLCPQCSSQLWTLRNQQFHRCTIYEYELEHFSPPAVIDFKKLYFFHLQYKYILETFSSCQVISLFSLTFISPLNFTLTCIISHIFIPCLSESSIGLLWFFFSGATLHQKRKYLKCLFIPPECSVFLLVIWMLRLNLKDHTRVFSLEIMHT